VAGGTLEQGIGPERGGSVIDLLASAGRFITMPDGSSEIKSMLLHRDPLTRERTLVIEFPPRFSRSRPGRYQAGEEILVLAGELLLDQLRLRSRDWAWLPPGLLRSRMSAPSGCIAYAWFSGPTEWERSDEQRPGPAARSEPLGSTPRLLRGDLPGDGPWRSGLFAAGHSVTGPAEVLDLDSFAWRRLKTGETRPAGLGTSFVRWAVPGRNDNPDPPALSTGGC
jgi:hypothetical protein